MASSRARTAVSIALFTIALACSKSSSGWGDTALVVGHGGGIEPGLVDCLPDADHESWGAPFGHCDGACLGFDKGKFVSVQFRRAPAELLPGSIKASGQ